MIDATKFFNHARTISLHRRCDRRDSFSEEWKKAMGTNRPLAFQYAPIPWWSWGFENLPKPAGHFPPPGAFGCAFAHVVSWATVLSDGNARAAAPIKPDDPLVFFEDDVTFCDGFAEKLALALPLVPDDWEIFYMGGEILTGRSRPKIIAEADGVKVGSVANVNRLHAYAVKVSAMTKLFPRILAYLTNAPQRTGPSGEESCFDYEVGRMCEDGTLKAYCVVPWLVGQKGLGSDTYPNSNNLAKNTRFFN